MKKIIALCCAFCLLFTATIASAESSWPAEEWEGVKARMLSGEALDIPAQYRTAIKQKDLYLYDASEKKSSWLNVALISTDAQDMRQNFGRSEAILICRINQKTGAFYLLSLPEYMNVSVPGCPEKVQLRFANCFGGPLLALDTINRELSLSVNRYCAINVDAFADVIDNVGGVTLTLNGEEAEALSLEKGTRTLNGAEAVAYLKLRRQWDGAERFRLLMEAMLRKMAARGVINGALSLVDAMLYMIDTNMTMDEIVSLAFALLEQQEIHSILSYRLEADAEGNMDEAARQACRDFLYGGTAAQ